ncbi:MAG: hypothetical protein WB341_02155, partial [Terracidiphilus sp.]
LAFESGNRRQVRFVRHDHNVIDKRDDPRGTSPLIRGHDGKRVVGARLGLDGDNDPGPLGLRGIEAAMTVLSATGGEVFRA